MKKQAYNPYLPSWEYIPDGEPYVFGDRVMYMDRMTGSVDTATARMITSAGRRRWMIWVTGDTRA